MQTIFDWKDSVSVLYSLVIPLNGLFLIVGDKSTKQHIIIEKKMRRTLTVLVSSFLFVLTIGVFTNVNMVSGQSCCALYNLPRNGSEYFALYGIANANNIHLCFDGGWYRELELETCSTMYKLTTTILNLLLQEHRNATTCGR